MASDTSPCRAGSKPDSHQRRCRLSRDTHHCRSRWIAMGTYFQAMITARRWTRLPRDCSHDPRGTLSEQTSRVMCHPCDMDALVQGDTGQEHLDFISI